MSYPELLAALLIGYVLGTWRTILTYRADGRRPPTPLHMLINSFLKAFARAQCERFGHRFAPEATLENNYLTRVCLRGCGWSEPIPGAFERIMPPGPSG